jgi:hypothetical protein
MTAREISSTKRSRSASAEESIWTPNDPAMAPAKRYPVIVGSRSALKPFPIIHEPRQRMANAMAAVMVSTVPGV